MQDEGSVECEANTVCLRQRQREQIHSWSKSPLEKKNHSKLHREKKMCKSAC